MDKIPEPLLNTGKDASNRRHKGTFILQFLSNPLFTCAPVTKPLSGNRAVRLE